MGQDLTTIYLIAAKEYCGDIFLGSHILNRCKKEEIKKCISGEMRRTIASYQSKFLRQETGVEKNVFGEDMEYGVIYLNSETVNKIRFVAASVTLPDKEK